MPGQYIGSQSQKQINLKIQAELITKNIQKGSKYSKK